MNKITEDLLKIVSDWKGIPDAAYNIREDTGCAGRRSTENKMCIRDSQCPVSTVLPSGQKVIPPL